ncbi:MAG: hypothetical protein ACW9W3_03480 [Candidatus Nitrosopumilus sp. bin_68KS]
MVNFEKIYQRVARQVIQRCHGAIKITKHGKIIEVYDTKRHIWSHGLAGLIIKEECRNVNLKEWEFSNVRLHIISILLEDKKGLLSTRLTPSKGRKEPTKKATQRIHTSTRKPSTRKPSTRKPSTRKPM